MYKDIAESETSCYRCQVTKGHYTGPHTHQVSFVANNPLDLLGTDLSKINPPKDGKEDVLILTDTFSKFSQAFVTSKQKALTITKLLLDRQIVLHLRASVLNALQQRSQFWEWNFGTPVFNV